MLCPKCGHENSDGARFCAKCGSPIRTAADANGADTTTIMDSSDKDAADKTTVMDGTGAGDTDQTTVADGSDETVVMGDPAKVGAPVSQSTNEEPIDETAPTTEGRPLPAGAVIAVAVTACVIAAIVAFFVYTRVYLPGQQQTVIEETSARETAAKKKTAAKKADKAKAEQADKKEKEAEQKAAEEAQKQADQQKQQAEQQQKINAAKAAGKQVATGTVHVFNTDADLANYFGGDDANVYTLQCQKNNDHCGPFIILVLDSPQTFTAGHADGSPADTSTASRISLDHEKRQRVANLWQPYDGKRVTVSLEDLWSPSDASLPCGNGTLRARNANVLF